LIQKREDGTWDNNYWIKEEPSEYVIDPASEIQANNEAESSSP
jgi:hypothetical protein